MFLRSHDHGAFHPEKRRAYAGQEKACIFGILTEANESYVTAHFERLRNPKKTGNKVEGCFLKFVNICIVRNSLSDRNQSFLQRIKIMSDRQDWDGCFLTNRRLLNRCVRQKQLQAKMQLT